MLDSLAESTMNEPRKTILQGCWYRLPCLLSSSESSPDTISRSGKKGRSGHVTLSTFLSPISRASSVPRRCKHHELQLSSHERNGNYMARRCRHKYISLALRCHIYNFIYLTKKNWAFCPEILFLVLQGREYSCQHVLSPFTTVFILFVLLSTYSRFSGMGA